MADALAPHRSIADLEARLADIRCAPRDAGTLELITRRPDYATRDLLHTAVLDVEAGLVGDHWSRRPSRTGPGGGPDPDKQLNVMSARAIAAIAGDRDNWALAGDQLYIDLHLGHDNLPTGTRLGVGGAVIEVTEPPHSGCAKFRRRYGADAIRFVNSDEGKALRLRGLCAKVIEPGTISTGDAVVKLAGT